MSVTLNTPFVSACDQATGSLSGVPTATLQAWLGEAQAALHQIRLGQTPTVVMYGAGEGNRSVTFTRTNEGTLVRYVADLQKALGIGRGRRAIGVGYMR